MGRETFQRWRMWTFNIYSWKLDARRNREGATKNGQSECVRLLNTVTLEKYDAFGVSFFSHFASESHMHTITGPFCERTEQGEMVVYCKEKTRRAFHFLTLLSSFFFWGSWNFYHFCRTVSFSSRIFVCSCGTARPPVWESRRKTALPSLTKATVKVQLQGH